MTRFQETVPRPIASLGTSLSRARCRRPILIDRMVSSLSAHGQLSPVVTVERGGVLQILDGFKRLAAAQRMGWTELLACTTQVDETLQWAMMLALNRGPQSMTELDEALVLRELMQTGLTQTRIAELVQRHKSWVSRRIGLVDRLHPELVEQMKLGLLAPGVARRLLSLSPGNQLQIAAAAKSANLGPRDTELLVSLWLRASNPAVRAYLLGQPRAALAQAHPQIVAPDPRLTLEGQKLSRLLGLIAGVGTRVLQCLPPTPSDRPLLAKPIGKAHQTICLLAKSLGSLASADSESVTGEIAALGSSCD